MSHKVSFVNRDGTTGNQTFPTLSIATIYAKGVKNGKVEDGGTDDTSFVMSRINAANAKKIADTIAAKSLLDPVPVRNCGCGRRCGIGKDKCNSCRKYL